MEEDEGLVLARVHAAAAMRCAMEYFGPGGRMPRSFGLEHHAEAGMSAWSFALYEVGEDADTIWWRQGDDPLALVLDAADEMSLMTPPGDRP